MPRQLWEIPREGVLLGSASKIWKIPGRDRKKRSEVYDLEILKNSRNFYKIQINEHLLGSDHTYVIWCCPSQH